MHSQGTVKLWEGSLTALVSNGVLEIENHKYLVQARDKFPDTKNAFPEVFEKVSRIGREGRLKSS